MAKIGENVKISIKVAVTGQVSSGKSTVCSYFKAFKAYVVDADKLVHKLLSPKTLIGKKVIEHFGLEIVRNNKIDRQKLSKIVFNDAKKLKVLEKLIHPPVLEEIEKLYKKHKDKYVFFVVELPLLFEVKAEKNFDYVITIVGNKKIQDKMKDYKDKSKKLLPIKQKISKSNFVIYNDFNFTHLKNEVKKIAISLNP